jgi:pantoate--beta-alanine ligase
MVKNSPREVKDTLTGVNVAETMSSDNPPQVNFAKGLTCSGKSTLRETVEAWRAAGLRVAFVPTMGALHEGHLDLVRLARVHADRVVASLFVNPTQFAPHEDFGSYPRTRERDLELLSGVGCDLVYCPEIADIYPFGVPATAVSVPLVSAPLEGVSRPHFFGGVASVVARLFLHVDPHVAVFGEKDYQQLQVVRRMVADLGFPVEIIGAPTRREPDGLAMSSRNRYLADSERTVAAEMFASLHRARQRLLVGTPVAEVLAEGVDTLSRAGFGPVDYFALCDADTLETLEILPQPGAGRARLLAAAWLGRTRLIDNLAVERVGDTQEG